MTELTSRTIFAGLLIGVWYYALDPVVYDTFNVIVHSLMIAECAFQIKTAEWSALCLLGVLAYKYVNNFSQIDQNFKNTFK